MARWMAMENLMLEDAGTQCSDRMWYSSISFYINCMKLNKLFDRFQAFIGSVVSWIYVKISAQAWLVDGQGLDLRPFIHCHDLSAFSRYGERHGRLQDGRIWCYLQAFCRALVWLLLISLNSYNLPCQCREFHCWMGHGDYGFELVECLPTD